MAAALPDAETDAAFAGQFVKPMLTIMDVGNAAPAVRLLNPAHIISLPPGFLVDRQSGLEPGGGSSRQASSGLQADLVTAFGMLEQFPEPEAILRHLGSLGLPVLCSFRARAGDDAPDGAKLSSFETLCAGAGFSIVWRYLNEGNAIYLLAPAGQDATGVTTVGYRNASQTVTVLQPKRPALLVAGFFGRSNCGDEALFQVIYEQLSSQFEIIVSLDEHGATDGYWNLYPYDRCQRIHQGNLADPARSCAGMIVGGGGLPLGFVADQVLAARSAGIPIALAGTDFPVSRLHDDDAAETACREYLRLFDFVALRSSTAVDQARRIGQPASHGADWAIRLANDENEGIRPDANRVLVVLREFPMAAVSFHYVREITRLVGNLRRAGFEPTLLPFCVEDDRFARALGLDLIAPAERHWWNARRVKQLIASSALVISVGRLHPMIFAASTRTPVLQLCPPLADGIDPRSFSKIAAMSEELGADYLPTVDSVDDHVRRKLYRPSGERQLAAAQDRLGAMITRLHSLFRQ